MTGAAAFDAVAPVYDRLGEHRLGRWLRDRVHERAEPLFPPGSRVLELGCGTGEDAVRLARRGVRVRAVDVSAGMLAEAARRVAAAGVGDRVELGRLDLDALGPRGFLDDGANGVDLHPPSPAEGGAPTLASVPFDGVFSDLGVLNCVRDRRALGRALAAALRPGAPLLLVVMGRFCAVEVLVHLLRGRPGVAIRRWRARDAHVGAGKRIAVDYPSPRRLSRELGPGFERRSCHGLGIVLPPTDLRHLVDRWPRLFALLERLDRRLAPLPGAARVADHWILELRRR